MESVANWSEALAFDHIFQMTSKGFYFMSHKNYEHLINEPSFCVASALYMSSLYMYLCVC